MMDTLSQSFYAASGGTLNPDDPSYIARQADHDLYEALQRGEYCYVLNSRQVGKSSLIVRTARRLRQEQIQVAVLELTKLGSSNASAEKWYRSLLDPIGRQLGKRAELVAFWRDHEELDALYRWMQALQQVVLSGSESVVICLDEIDSVQALPFSVDEFFAAIRECFNARTQEPELQRLTFCLVGVLTPSELIKNPLITPFNIGRRIDLADLTLEEMKPLAQGLGREEPLAHELLTRIWYWTNGHPYLTQVLCEKVANDATVTRPAGVDRLCEEWFLSSRARERETNLQHVRTLILRKDLDQAAVLDLYRQVRRRKRVKDDDTNPIINALRLAGLIRVVEDYLWIRNRIYFRAFDEAWILANMPDAEKRRQEAARRLGFIQASAIATGVIASMAWGGYWYFDSYVWEHATYCNTFAKRFGVMECVGELTDQQVQGRAVSYKFIRTGRKNPVWKVQAVRGLSGELAVTAEEKSFAGTKSSDILTSRHGIGTYFKSESSGETTVQKPAQWEFVLDATGKIVYEKAYTSENQLVWGLVYSPPLEGQPAHAHYVGDDGYPRPQAKSTAEFVEFSYSDLGDEVKVRYFDRAHQPQVGLNGAFVIEKQFDSRGLTIGKAYFDAKNQPILNQYGFFHKVATQFDARGNLIETAFFGTDGQPILHKDGYHKYTTQYDARGNEIETAYFGTDGQPILHKDGYHKYTTQYDARGNQIEQAFFGIDGQPILLKDGLHKWTSQFDARGNQIEQAFFGTDGQPILLKDSYHKLTSQYDARGNLIELAFFGTDGQPILLKDGYHKYTAQFDAWGNEIETAFFGTDGQPILHKDGLHKWTAQYDARGNLIETAYFGTDGLPILHKNGNHKWTAQYDARGNQIETAYFGTDGQPILLKDGWHKWTSQFDARGNQIERAYFVTDGLPILLKDGYHKWTRQYDERGNGIEEAFFGTDGLPILLKEYGYHKWTDQYDAQGNVIETSYFGTDGQPILLKDGVHKWTAQYDARGNQTEVAFFGTNELPILSNEGFHKGTAQFDARGNQTEVAYFGTDGLPIAINGIHRVVEQFNELGNVVDKQFFDINGQRIGENNSPSLWQILADALKPKQVTVVSVLPDSQAEQLGIQAGDMLTEYDGKPIFNMALFIFNRNSEPAAGPAKALKILRDGKELTFMVKPGKIGVELKDQVK